MTLVIQSRFAFAVQVEAYSVRIEVLTQDHVYFAALFGDDLSFVGEHANIHSGFPFHIPGAEQEAKG